MISASELVVSAAVAIAAGAFIMGLFSRRNHFGVAGKTVLLTGASSGMGLSVAKQLAAKGARIAIVARDANKLEAALTAIRAAAASPSQAIHSFSADLSKPGEASRIVAEVSAWNGGAAPDVAWCIAGASAPQLFLDADAAALRSQMDVNYWAAADTAQAILKEWLAPAAARSANERHLIFTCTTLAFFPIVGYAPYSPCKAALKALCDTLSQEVLLYSDSVKLHTVFPGSIDSPGFATENVGKPGITKVLEEPDPVQQPDEVARAAIAGLERGESLVTVNFIGSAMRSIAWGGSLRNNWLVDTVFTSIVSAIFPFILGDMNRQVKKYGQKHGHPSTY